MGGGSRRPTRRGVEDAAPSTTRSAPTPSKGCFRPSEGEKRRWRSGQGGPPQLHTEGCKAEEDRNQHQSPSQQRHGHGSSSEPPTPPTRRESTQQSRGAPPVPPAGGSSGTFEARFGDKFRSMQYLPPPEQFHRCQKTYPSASSSK